MRWLITAVAAFFMPRRRLVAEVVYASNWRCSSDNNRAHRSAIGTGGSGFWCRGGFPAGVSVC